MFGNDKAGARLGRMGLIGAGIVALAVASAPRPGLGQKYDTPEEAYRVGVASLSLRQYEKARPPLEQAISMAQDDPTRLRIYPALILVYFHAGETDKVIKALDFILTKSHSEPERVNMRRNLIGYAQQQGKTDEIITLYENRLKTDPNDVPALYVLSDIYSQLRPNPKRSGELVDRLASILKKSGGDLAPYAGASLAEQYVKAGKFKEGAAMFEKVAEGDPSLAAWNYKEAAQAWLKAGDKAKAKAAAKLSDSVPPESRNDLLAHFWNRHMGDIYLQTGEPALAVPHYEQAIAKTTIDGYVKDTKKSLAQAQNLAARSGSGTTTGRGTAAAKPGAAAATNGKPGSVDLNRASLAQLQAVNGISEDLAIQIIDHRKAKPFSSVSELIELEGIDKALLAKIRPALTVGPAK